jgi:hypothetical protein
VGLANEMVRAGPAEDGTQFLVDGYEDCYHVGAI